MTKSRAALVIFLAIFVLVLHAAGVFLQLYWRVEWYDHVVHIMAGATTSLIIFSLGSFGWLRSRPLMLFTSIFLVSLIIGGLWEFFELQTGITSLSDSRYILDTTGDMVSDVVGGLVAGAYLLFI